MWTRVFRNRGEDSEQAQPAEDEASPADEEGQEAVRIMSPSHSERVRRHYQEEPKMEEPKSSTQAMIDGITELIKRMGAILAAFPNGLTKKDE
jgi:hypothetical protein